MKLIDVFPDALSGSGIFDALDTYNVPWKSDISAISLDLEYFGNISGDKTVSPLVRKLCINGVLSPTAISKIAQSLYSMHGLRWSKLWNTYQLEYDPIQNYNMTEIMSDDDTVTTYGRTHSKTGTEIDDRTRTDDNTESIYGFNSSTASDSDESDRTINDDNTHTYNVSDTDTGSDRQSHSYELTRSGNIGVTTSQQMVESERSLWMWKYFYDVVFPDVDKVLTISVYSTDVVDDLTQGAAPTGEIDITLNGTYDVMEYASAAVQVPNTYTTSDENKVVHNGALVSQSSQNITENGQYDTTLISGVNVQVPNTYTAADEGKVVNNGSLVTQGELTINENGEYDTTLISAVNVNIDSIIEGVGAPTSDIGENGDYYKQIFPIPTEVSFVEYLQSSGTQYINTGIYATQDIDAIVTGDRRSGDSAAGVMFGVRSGSWTSMTKALYFGSHTDNSTAISVIKTGASNLGSLVACNGVTTRRTQTLRNGSYYVYLSSIDEIPTYSKLYRQSGAWQSDMPLCMFGFYNGTTLNVSVSTRVNRVTVLDKGAPIADYIPCLDTNNVACMWDNVAGEYVYNTGTGDFVYGSSITPDELDPVLWVKNNNTWSVVGW